MTTTSHANEIATEVEKLVTAGASEIEKRIRSELEEEFQKEKEQRLQDEIDKELQDFLPNSYRDQSYAGDGGIIDMKGDHFYASALQGALSDHWTPLTVQASSSDGNPTDGDVKRALETMMLGCPVQEELNGVGDENIAMLMQVMRSCEQKAEMDPHAVSIVRTEVDYTVGTGMQYSCSVDKVEEVLKDFDRRNKLSRRVPNMVRNRTIYGEHYFFLFVDKKTGDIHLRDRTKPYDIRSIKTHSEDAETRLAYGRIKNDVKATLGAGEKYDWFADVDYFDQKSMPGGQSVKGLGTRLRDNKLVYMCKEGPSFSSRGKPVMYPILRYLKYYEDFITDRIILNHERTKVVWVRKVMGNRGIPGGRAVRGPVGGQILTETPQIEWRIENASINASDVTEDGRLMRLAIASNMGSPEHIIFQDPSQQVYASIRTSETPFSQRIGGQQKANADDMEAIFRVQVREKVKSGTLPPKVETEVFTMESQQIIQDEVVPMVKEGATKDEIYKTIETLSGELPSKTISVDTVNVPIEIKFPDVVQQNPLDAARESEVLDRIGILSKTELALRHSANYKRTATLKNLERGWVQDETDEEGRASSGAVTRNKNDNVNSEQGKNDK